MRLVAREQHVLGFDSGRRRLAPAPLAGLAMAVVLLANCATRAPLVRADERDLGDALAQVSPDDTFPQRLDGPRPPDDFRDPNRDPDRDPNRDSNRDPNRNPGPQRPGGGPRPPDDFRDPHRDPNRSPGPRRPGDGPRPPDDFRDPNRDRDIYRNQGPDRPGDRGDNRNRLPFAQENRLAQPGPRPMAMFERILDALRGIDQRLDRQSQQLHELEQRLGGPGNAGADEFRFRSDSAARVSGRNAAERSDALRRQQQQLVEQRDERLAQVNLQFEQRTKQDELQRELRERQNEIEAQLATLQRKRAQLQFETQARSLGRSARALQAKLEAAVQRFESGTGPSEDVEVLRAEVEEVNGQLEALQQANELDEMEHALRMKAQAVELQGQREAGAALVEAERMRRHSEIAQQFGTQLHAIELQLQSLDQARD